VVTEPATAKSGSITVGRYPHARLRVACEHCGRFGDYSTARLAKAYGAYYPLPDLKADLTTGCPRTGYGPSRCQAIFPDLAPAAGRATRHG